MCRKCTLLSSDKPVSLYSLDVILSVCYRVNSKRGTNTAHRDIKARRERYNGQDDNDDTEPGADMMFRNYERSPFKRYLCFSLCDVLSGSGYSPAGSTCFYAENVVV